MRTRIACAALTILVLCSRTNVAEAAPILASPSDPSYSASLGNLAAGYQLQQDTFAALEFGLSLDVNVTASQVPLVRNFFAQSATTDFETFSGMQPFAVLDSYGEYEDIGNFGGIASVGVAARLMALKAQGGSAGSIAAARAAAVLAAEAWHVYATIGGPGVIARGIQRTTPLDPSTGPLPGTLPTLIPLKDASGNPLPNPKAQVWRAPVASGYDDWIWLDDTSKDQVSGYALAAAWLWDALVDDPMVDPSIPAALAADLVVFAKALMVPAPDDGGIDLCIRDADGRLTDFHDLNPREVLPGNVVPANNPIQNGFNAAMALGIILAAYHVSGDPVVGAYYYDELVKNRDYPRLMSQVFVYLGADTNYSNVNMQAISFGLLGRFETDPALRASFAKTVETTFWSVEPSYDVESVAEAWFDDTYAGVSASPTTAIRARVAASLGGFPTPPAFSIPRTNCSAADIDAGECLGIDGTTTITLEPPGSGFGGTEVATEPLPMSIRPLSDFLWRSDPHMVNGGGPTNLLDPGGDFLAAYWLARIIDLEDPAKNVTPLPRAPYDGGVGAADGGLDAAPHGGMDSAAPSKDSGLDASGRSESPGGGSCNCSVLGATPNQRVGGLGIGFGCFALLARRARSVRRLRPRDPSRRYALRAGSRCSRRWAIASRNLKRGA